MARSLKYGDVVIPGIPDDEPIFILRAQDVAAIPTLSAYAGLVSDEVISREYRELLGDVMAEFVQWREENRDKMKAPD